MPLGKNDAVAAWPSGIISFCRVMGRDFESLQGLQKKKPFCFCGMKPKTAERSSSRFTLFSSDVAATNAAFFSRTLFFTATRIKIVVWLLAESVRSEEEKKGFRSAFDRRTCKTVGGAAVNAGAAYRRKIKEKGARAAVLPDPSFLKCNRCFTFGVAGGFSTL
jgi:hypothetical protein